MSSDDGQPPPAPHRVPSPDDPTRTASPSAVAGPSRTVAVSDPERPRDRYQIIGEHGRGGLGRVSRAHDRELHRDVAIKELISRAPLSEVRFLREALITARLEHPGIVPVHEAGRWPDGTPFYAMKLVAGRSLRELIAERHTVAERIALLHHVIAVADAMAYAHQRNIIHRDLKPANVIVGDFGETIVIDWGLAKDLSVSDDSAIDGGESNGSGDHSGNIELTTTGSVLGTPAYMAPEQARGEHVDQRADVFAIGAMLWELCALHKVPPSNVRHRHRILRRAGIDGDLITILDKSLALAPAQRYRDASSLAADLKAFKSGARIAARSYSLPAMLAHWTRRHRGLALSVAAVVAVAALGIVLYVRNISVERDRANTQTLEANKQRADATAARDRAQLSEINTLLEKDPTRALELLQKVTDRTPQYALLMSRATQRAASKVIKFKDSLVAMRQATDRAEVAITTEGGELFIMPLDTGELQLVDRHAVGPLVYSDDAWWYTRREFGAATQATNNRTGAPLIDTHGLASEFSSYIFVADGHLHTHDDSGNVYRIDNDRPIRIAHDIDKIVTGGDFTLTCDREGKLTILHNNIVILESTCATATTTRSMVAVSGHYAAVKSPNTLLVDGRELPVPTSLSTSHELAMAASGLVAIADYQGGAWYAKVNSQLIEPAPKRAMSPLSTAAAGSLVAWGYQDGSSVVIDTESQETWEFIGQSEAIAFLALDATKHRLVTASWHEIRFWDLRPNPLKLEARLPCTPSQIAATSSPSLFSLNCSDGSVRIWDAYTDHISSAHRHEQYSEGLAQYGAMLCSGGWEGDIICSTLDGAQKQTLFSGHGRIRNLIQCATEQCLLASTADGNVWKINDQPLVLFSHTDVPSVMNLSPDGRWLASGSEDGSLIIYDFHSSRQLSVPSSHQTKISVLVWRDSTLWTADKTGVINSWTLTGLNATPRREYVEDGAIMAMIPLTRGLAFGSAPEQLQLPSGMAPVKLNVDKPVRVLQVSSDHRYLAAMTYQELLVFDLQHASLAAIRPTRSLQSLYFVHGSKLALCARGAILTIDLDRLSYVSYLLDLPSK